MAQIDRLLSAVVEKRGEALQLQSGEPAQLVARGKMHPLTKPLSTAQVAGLVREGAPREALDAMGQGRPTKYRYAVGAVTFTIRVMQDGEALRVECRPEADADVAEVQATAPSERAVPAEVGPAEEASVPLARASGVAGAVIEHDDVTAPIEEPTTLSPARVPKSRESTGHGAVRPVPRRALGGDGEQASAPSVRFPDTAALRAAKERMDTLLRHLSSSGSSDLHLRVGEPPIIRKAGEMVRIEGQSVLTELEVSTMITAIIPDQNATEFTESSDTDFAYELPGVARFRANVLAERNGMAAVFRVIPSTVLTVEQLGITPEVQKLCFLTKGLVLVTGPTGSGKSTTLSALIDLVNRSRHDHIITIEDPIEFVHQNKNCIVTQRQVGVHTASFKSALRAALREDPGIILVGELRDLETVSIAIETAETGHLVFGTLHTTTAASTIDRVIDQFPADRQDQVRTMLSESLKGVVAQVLCKKIGGGRVAAQEILIVNTAISNLIREGKTFQIPSMIQAGRRTGMITMNDSLLKLVDQKVIEPKEAWMKAVDKPSLVAQLKSRGLNLSFAEGDLTSAAANDGEPDSARPPAGAGRGGS